MLKSPAREIFNETRRRLVLLLVYCSIFAFSLILAFEFREDFTINWDSYGLIATSIVWVIGAKLVSMILFGQFKGLLTFFRLPDIYQLAAAMGLPTFFMFIASFWSDEGVLASRSVILLDFFFSLSLLCLFRTALRIYRERSQGYASPKWTGLNARESVIIYGAGNTGSALSSHLISKKGKLLNPVAFVDDDESKWNRSIHGIKVFPSLLKCDSLREKYGVRKLIIAMPSASPSKIGEITTQAKNLELSVEIVPSWDELVSGRKKVDMLRPIRIEDLLGRNAVNLHSSRVFDMVKGKIVMVTGAGGTIGGELCRQIAQCEPSLLIMVERAEYLLFQIDQAIKSEFPDVACHAFIGDVTDEARMDFLLEGFLPQNIFHAAAHKHVPMMEHQPGEAIRNNTFGTVTLADLAIRHGVEKFVLISSDKAVNPTNVMGVSKRLAEIFIQSLQESSQATQFVAVRFGNVLGSSGSVIPTFRRQIESGGPVMVTHPEITRYFMTVSEAVGLVLECSSYAKGGDIFVLDMGEPLKIYDLAKQMIALSGLELNRDVEIKFAGLRPGEKLHEELQYEDEMLQPTSNSKVFKFQGRTSKESEIRGFLRELGPLLSTSDYNALKREIRNFVPEYEPDLSAPNWAHVHAKVAAAYRRSLALESDKKIVALNR